MKTYEMIFEDGDDEYGLFSISLVKKPAIQENFIALSEQKEIIKLKSIDDEKRILLGAALVPNKQILRVNEKTKENFYIVFPEETIRLASQAYLIRGMQNNSNIEHTRELVEGVHLVESWIVEDPEKDKSAVYNLEYEKGTWMVVLKVVNDDVWDNYVKTGEIKGFSIEGSFMQREKTLLSALSEEDELAQIIKAAFDE